MPTSHRFFLRAVATVSLCVAFSAGHAQTANDRVQALSAKFWEWRATEQPFTNDDIPRIDRASGFVAHWSAKDVAAYRARIADFEKEWRALDVKDAPVPVQVDYRLVGSAIARVRWELDVIPVWQRSPFFYVDQGLTAVYTLMLRPAPFEAERQRDVVARLASIPRLLDEGRANLTDMRQPYATVAMSGLNGMEVRLGRFKDGVHAAANFSPENLQAFDKAEDDAVKALVAYREWLRPQLAGLKKETAVGREGYLYFLRNVALLSYTPEQIQTIGELEFERAVAFESLQQAANTGLADTPIYPDARTQNAAEEVQERAIRAYNVSHGVMSDPAMLTHYHYVETPQYLAGLTGLGVSDYLTSVNHLQDESVSYKGGKPRVDGGFFGNITARDVRPLTIHEGSPGHFFQMSWSFHNADPVRRYYYDSESQEGIGFYAEEMEMIAGLFDKEPKTKEAIYSMMRLRALRVVVDVKLALGEFTLEQASKYLQDVVPMDAGTANGEAAMFASTPGQAITYQLGKTDILKLMKDARAKQGAAFKLQGFHDFVWSNGSLPFSLQRWEMLGDASAVPAVPPTFAWKK